MDFVSIGHILRETLYDKDGNVQYVLGGPAAYTTVAAAKLGADVGIVTTLGEDMPKEMIEVFYESKIDLKGFHITDGHTRTNEFGYGADGKRRMLSYKKIADKITWKHIPQYYIKTSKAFFIGPCYFDFDVDLVNRIRKESTAIIFGDIGGLGGTGRTPDTKATMIENSHLLKAYIKNYDFLKCSDDDIEYILGEKEADIKRFIQEILTWGPKAILYTKGSKGMEIINKEGKKEVEAFSSNAIDTTGAGDCFSSGFLYNYIRTKDVVKACRFGTILSSYVVEKTGGVNIERMPSLEDINERLKC